MSDRSSEILRRQLDDVADIATGAVDGLMDTLDTYPLDQWARVLRGLLPDLVDQYGAIAGELAVDYYTDRRAILLDKLPEDVEKPKPYKATTAAIPTDAIRQRLTKASDAFIGKIFNGIQKENLTVDNPVDNPAEVVDNLPTTFREINTTEREALRTELRNIIQRDVLNYSRETLAIMAEEDPAPIVATRNVNSGGCELCKELRDEGVTRSFHKGCRCTTDLVLQ